jgi:hypothetical protein
MMPFSDETEKLPGWKPPFLSQKSKSLPSSTSSHLNSECKESPMGDDSGDEFYDCSTPPPSTPHVLPLQLPGEPLYPSPCSGRQQQQQQQQQPLLRTSQSVRETAPQRRFKEAGRQDADAAEGAAARERLMLIRTTLAERCCTVYDPVTQLCVYLACAAVVVSERVS